MKTEIKKMVLDVHSLNVRKDAKGLYYCLMSGYAGTCVSGSSVACNNIGEAVKEAFDNFATDCNEKEIWKEEVRKPFSYGDDITMVLDYNSEQDFIQYETKTTGKIVCTIKIGNNITTALSSSYQSATRSACEKMVNAIVWDLRNNQKAK